jgi:hypothetical protein
MIRKYRVYYYKEINDECVDCEIVIESDDIETVPFLFHDKIRLGKINRIEEIL